jgi:ABC-type phosphate transport system permease subunit
MAASTTAPAPSRGAGFLGALRRPWSDRRAELLLGAAACTVLLFVAGMLVFVFTNAWPSFRENGLGWLTAPPAGTTVDEQIGQIFQSPADPARYQYELNAWPLIWGTALTTGFAVILGTIFATLSALFIVEFAPPRVRDVLRPVVTLLAGVPSVVYGLIGILVVVPFVARFISEERKESVAGIISLTGESWTVGVLILTFMIVPIMISIISEALRQVPASWKEGAHALGVNRFRVAWTISVRTARPAIIAAAVLATARALGEAIMRAMVTGSIGFAPNPIDGITFFLEPTRPLAATIVANNEGLTVQPFKETIYAFAAVLLLSAMALSVGGYVAKQPLKRYGIRA